MLKSIRLKSIRNIKENAARNYFVAAFSLLCRLIKVLVFQIVRITDFETVKDRLCRMNVKPIVIRKDLS